MKIMSHFPQSLLDVFSVQRHPKSDEESRGWIICTSRCGRETDEQGVLVEGKKTRARYIASLEIDSSASSHMMVTSFPRRPVSSHRSAESFSGLAGLKLMAQLPFKEVSANDAASILPVLVPIDLQS